VATVINFAVFTASCSFLEKRKVTAFDSAAEGINYSICDQKETGY